MHELFVAATFIAMVAAPCVVTLFRQNEEESEA
jgi:hypothetical protein